MLEHDFWWADSRSTSHLATAVHSSPVLVLHNPVRADVQELQGVLGSEVVGRPPSATGLLPDDLLGPESWCGWRAVSGSKSGALQAVLIMYGVPSLIRLAYAQRRIRPTDLDVNQDSRISFEELVNFIYFNLESLLHVMMAVLLIVIGVSRVAAGPECETGYVQAEKNATAVAALFLFINLFIVCKPYKGIGLLVLTIYQFLVSDVFNFLIMYSIFFTAFLLCLQTLHGANHIFLAWMETTTTIAPQIELVTGNLSYLVNANIPTWADQLVATHMAIDGCQASTRSIYDTGFTLLEISFGDGLADGLMEARRRDYACPGFNPDGIVGYVIVFWMFLTNVLVLNMLVAMMSNTLDAQTQGVGQVWLLDVSYRVMRYEGLFPELADRMQRPVTHYSLWSRQYWESTFWDACLACYCIPEVHLLGFTRMAYFRVVSELKRALGSNRQQLPAGWESVLWDLARNVEKIMNKKEDNPRKEAVSGACVGPWTGSIADKVVAVALRPHAVRQVGQWEKLLVSQYGRVERDITSKMLLLGLIHQVRVKSQVIIWVCELSSLCGVGCL